MHHIKLGTLMPNRSGRRSPSHHWGGHVNDNVPSHSRRARRPAQPSRLVITMIQRVRQPKYRDPGRSFELLKTKWKSGTSDALWLLLRSITIREHLHTTGYFERNFATSRVVNSSFLLRRRRREIALRLRTLGCEVSDILFKHSLPKRLAWRAAMGKLQGTRPDNSPERTREKRSAWLRHRRTRRYR